MSRFLRKYESIPELTTAGRIGLVVGKVLFCVGVFKLCGWLVKRIVVGLSLFLVVCGSAWAQCGTPGRSIYVYDSYYSWTKLITCTNGSYTNGLYFNYTGVWANHMSRPYMMFGGARSGGNWVISHPVPYGMTEYWAASPYSCDPVSDGVNAQWDTSPGVAVTNVGTSEPWLTMTNNLILISTNTFNINEALRYLVAEQEYRTAELLYMIWQQGETNGPSQGSVVASVTNQVNVSISEWLAGNLTVNVSGGSVSVTNGVTVAGVVEVTGDTYPGSIWSEVNDYDIDGWQAPRGFDLAMVMDYGVHKRLHAIKQDTAHLGSISGIVGSVDSRLNSVIESNAVMVRLVDDGTNTFAATNTAPDVDAPSTGYDSITNSVPESWGSTLSSLGLSDVFTKLGTFPMPEWGTSTSFEIPTGLGGVVAWFEEMGNAQMSDNAVIVAWSSTVAGWVASMSEWGLDYITLDSSMSWVSTFRTGLVYLVVIGFVIFGVPQALRVAFGGLA